MNHTFHPIYQRRAGGEISFSIFKVLMEKHLVDLGAKILGWGEVEKEKQFREPVDGMRKMSLPLSMLSVGFLSFQLPIDKAIFSYEPALHR